MQLQMHGHRKHPKSFPTSSASVVECLLSLGNQIHNNQLLLVCPKNVWPVGQGSNLRQTYSEVGAINNKQSTQWKLLKLYTNATITGGGMPTMQPTAVGVVD